MYCTKSRERFSLQSLVFPDCARITCPEGWLPFEDKCYYFSPNTKSWDEARRFCQEHYSHLVIINSLNEQVSYPSKPSGTSRASLLLSQTYTSFPGLDGKNMELLLSH